MSPAAHLTGFRPRIRVAVPVLLILSAMLALTACGSPAPASPTAASKAAAPTSAPAKPSPGASPAAKPSPSPSPVAGIQIVDATLADATPWVSLRIPDGEPQIVSGWRLEVGAQSLVVPGNAIVQPGDMLFLHVGEGMSSEREVFLGAESQALALAAAPGATVRLVNPAGEVMAQTTVPRY